MKNRVLYISYDGILEPLGQSQVLSYLEELSAEYKIYLISFEKSLDKNNVRLFNTINSRIEDNFIEWHPLRYHKSPSSLATLWDIFSATLLGFWLVYRKKMHIVHARSYVPSITALLLKKVFKTKYIFDMRGFWADERVDGGIWKVDGYLYRTSKWFEKLFLLNADVVISLTNAAVEEMKKFSYLKEKKINYIVITTCTDLSVFKPSTTLNIVNPKEKPFIVGYVGSVGVWYMFRESLEFYKLIKEIIPDAQLHILNKGGHDYIEKSLVKEGVNRSNVLLETKDREGVVSAMQLMDVGLFMIKPLYSKIASMPTKLGEFLACGIPCVGNSGVGDMADIIVNERVGVILNSFEKDEKIKCVSDLLELINDADHKKRCVKTAFQYFSLKNGVESYKKIYQSLNDK